MLSADTPALSLSSLRANGPIGNTTRVSIGMPSLSRGFMLAVDATSHHPCGRQMRLLQHAHDSVNVEPVDSNHTRPKSRGVTACGRRAGWL